MGVRGATPWALFLGLPPRRSPAHSHHHDGAPLRRWPPPTRRTRRRKTQGPARGPTGSGNPPAPGEEETEEHPPISPQGGGGKRGRRGAPRRQPRRAKEGGPDGRGNHPGKPISQGFRSTALRFVFTPFTTIFPFTPNEFFIHLVFRFSSLPMSAAPPPSQVRQPGQDRAQGKGGRE